MTASLKHRNDTAQENLIRWAAPKLIDDITPRRHDDVGCAGQPLRPPVKFSMSVVARVDAKLQSMIDSYHARHPEAGE